MVGVRVRIRANAEVEVSGMVPAGIDPILCEKRRFWGILNYNAVL